MRHRPSRTTAQKIRRLFPVLAVMLVLYGLASQNYLMLFSIGIGLLILWSAMHQAWIYQLLQQILTYFEKPTPATPPDVHSSQAVLERSLPEQPLYEQGYQEQALGHTNKKPKEDSAAMYDYQPQAQYPEPLPPMR